jgi:hypothetical protein
MVLMKQLLVVFTVGLVLALGTGWTLAAAGVL